MFECIIPIFSWYFLHFNSFLMADFFSNISLLCNSFTELSPYKFDKIFDSYMAFSKVSNVMAFFVWVLVIFLVFVLFVDINVCWKYFILSHLCLENWEVFPCSQCALYINAFIIFLELWNCSLKSGNTIHMRHQMHWDLT